MRYRWTKVVMAAALLYPPLLLRAVAYAQEPISPGDAEGEHARQESSTANAVGEAIASFSVRIEKDVQQRVGLKLETLQPAQFQPTLSAFGRLEQDPSRSFTVRAAVTGYLRTDDHAWPRLGAMLAAGTPLGVIEPRLTPMEQLDLASQRLEASAAIKETQAELEAAQASYKGKRALNADGKMVSDRQLEEAAARVASGEARLAAAQRKLELLETQLQNPTRGLEAVPVMIERDGQVVDVFVSPGEMVDTGQMLLRVVDFDRLVARVELPLGETWQVPADAEPRISAVGDNRVVVGAALLGRAAQVGGDTQGESWMLAVTNEQGVLRPGAPIVAHLPQADQTLHGVVRAGAGNRPLWGPGVGVHPDRRDAVRAPRRAALQPGR